MQTELPPGLHFDAHIAQTYDESGWCFVEAAISAGLKVGKRRLDLAKRTDYAMGHAYGGNWIPQEAMLEGVCAAARPPPLLPDEVRRRLDEKKFTSKADVHMVDGLYRAFFGGAADSAAQLNFSGLDWGEAEARQLKEVLPRFTRLKALDLSRNKLGAAGASAIASLLKTMQISSLKRAAQPRTLPQWLRVLSAPADKKANTLWQPIMHHSDISCPCVSQRRRQQHHGRRGQPSGHGGAGSRRDDRLLRDPAHLAAREQHHRARPAG